MRECHRFPSFRGLLLRFGIRSTVPPGGRACQSLLSSGIVLALTGCSSELPAPHVVLVIVDTLRADALGCYGNPQNPTPHLDSLAAQAVRFDQAASVSGWTLPSVASLLTGAWPTVHRALGKNTRLTPITTDVPTAAELLSQRGYRTLGVANAAFLSPLLGLDRGFDEFDHRHAYNWEIRRAAESMDTALERWKEDLESPTFLMIHLFDPHLDYDPPAEFANLYVEGRTDPPPPLTMKQCRALGAHPNPQRARANVEYMEGLFLAEVTYVDQQIERLVDELKQMGVYEQSHVIVTADHGEEFWDHGGFEHGHTLYEELVRVPWIWKFPESFAWRGKVIKEPVQTLDFLPTLFAAQDWYGPQFGGSSVLPCLIDEPGQRRLIHGEATLYGADKFSVRRGRYKFIQDRSPQARVREELYDLNVDPGERNNLVKSLPEVAESLRHELEKHREAVEREGRSMAQPPVRNMSPREVEKYVESLEALGYVRDE